MTYEVKNAIMQGDSSGENFKLIDPEGYFKNRDVLIAIDSDTLITIQILIKSILKNDFKKWNEITNFSDSESIASLFIKLGYTKEEVAKFLNEL